jgi:hypothetical protein
MARLASRSSSDAANSPRPPPPRDYQLEPYKEPGQRTRHRYLLTEKGADFFPVIVSLMQWGNRWLSDTGGPAELLHRGCGAVVHTELRCEHGHHVELADLDLAATE